MLNHILIPLDGSSLAECVLPHAVALAQPFDATLTLLQVLDRPPTISRSQSIPLLDWHIRKAEATSYLDGVSGRLKEMHLDVQTVVTEGRIAEQVVEFAHGNDIDMILLSSHGRSGLSGWNISSVVQKVALMACLPTMIVRAYRMTSTDLAHLRYRRLLVPLDCSQRAESVLPLVTTLARHHQSDILLAHVVCTPEMPHRAPPTPAEHALVVQIVEQSRRKAQKYLEQVQGPIRSTSQILLLSSHSVAAALHNLVQQEKVDLVILSAHGYSGENRWPYGSVALNFIAYGTTPLLIVQDLSRDELGGTQAQLAARERTGH